ncbi:MAG TPA: CBS domain-containing protein [Gaiellaceae bacterium]|jgi:tRNA nucleotidyltransferase (CCA-adding enzyme)|nr:CBS domain-containing protein [Gaiellaceae bacterium]
MKATEVIATHTNTDFDAFAAMLAARLLYPNAVVSVSGALNRNVREFYRLHADELDAVETSRLETDAIRRLIVVETTSASRLGELEEVALDPDVEKVIFDHHAGKLPDWVKPENAVISQDGALTTTLAGVLAEREIAVTPLEATAFALGIHEDTGSLTYPTATQRDADALAWCLRHGAQQELLASFLHTPLGDDERDLLGALMEALESERVAGVEVLIAAVTWPRHVDGVSNLAHKIADLTDTRALVLLVEMGDRVFCVTRSRTPAIDAAAIARALGGGGHREAASAMFRGALADARAVLSAGLEAAVAEPSRAERIMSRPARSVSPDETVSRAMVACQRYAQSGILVLEEGQLVGAVSREDLDKAIAHGLSHAPVKGIMSSRVATVEADAPLAEVQEALAASPDGRVAVLEEGAVVGVVTRSDLLRALGERPEAEVEPGASLADELSGLTELAPVFEAVAAASEPYDGVYLVGGTVRDILLGEPNFDVDIAVEGDAIGLARSVADAIDGRVRAHSKFGTAVVVYGEEQRIDVVTARTEFYDAPAALPSVEHATIREDLFRRDFTINAMAVSLKGEDFGRLVDPFHGRRDLEAKRVRVLHNLSFIDDPTRIFRAIRYESRYGFRMDEHTQRLARGTIEMGLVGDLSSARLRDELIALLEEGDAGVSILRLAELEAGRAIHPHLAADEEAVDLLERLRALNQRYGTGIPAWRLAVEALARRLPPDEIYDWLQRLKVQRRDAERIAWAVTVGPRLVERLRGDTPEPAEIVALAEPYAPDAPLFALALADPEPLHDYFERLRDVRLEVSGADLAKLGVGESPQVGEILGELRRRKLNGQLDGRESELAAARELIGAA